MNTSENLNGQQRAALGLQRFREWISERDTAGDRAEYWRGDERSRPDRAYDPYRRRMRVDPQGREKSVN